MRLEPHSCRNAVVKVNNSIATVKSYVNRNTKTYSCQDVPRSCMNTAIKVNEQRIGTKGLSTSKGVRVDTLLGKFFIHLDMSKGVRVDKKIFIFELYHGLMLHDQSCFYYGKKIFKFIVSCVIRVSSFQTEL